MNALAELYKVKDPRLTETNKTEPRKPEDLQDRINRILWTWTCILVPIERILTPEELRESIKTEIEFIVKNKWQEIIEELITWKYKWSDFDSEFHSILSKQYPLNYSYALEKTWMQYIGWLSQFWHVFRNLIIWFNFNKQVSKEEVKDIIISLFLKIKDITKIPLIDIELFRNNITGEEFDDFLKTRKWDEITYIKRSRRLLL